MQNEQTGVTRLTWVQPTQLPGVGEHGSEDMHEVVRQAGSSILLIWSSYFSDIRDKCPLYSTVRV